MTYTRSRPRGDTYDYGVRGCNGAVVPDRIVDFYDAMAVQHRNYAHLDDLETRRQLYAEDIVVRALATVADRAGTEERSAFGGPQEFRAKHDEADRIARDHGFGPDRLIAMKGLARSRDVDLETVLRAALRGELRSIVALPAVTTSARRED